MRNVSLIIAATAVLASCVTATPAPPPQATARTGGPFTAALLPWYTNDATVAKTAYDQVSQCLERVGVFTLTPRAEVEKVVAEQGVVLNKTFGPSDEDFQKVGQALKVDYVLGGAFTVMKDLTFSGWRDDISSDLRLHKGATGLEAGYWQSNTGFTWASSETATNVTKMSESAMNHMCAQIAAPGAF